MYLKNSDVIIKNGDIINIHQTVNGCSLFYIKSIDPLDIRYEYDKERKYEYDKYDLLDIEEITIENSIYDLNYILNRLSFFNWLENKSVLLESGNTPQESIKNIFNRLPKYLQLDLIKEFVFEKYNLFLTLSNKNELFSGVKINHIYENYIEQQEKSILEFLSKKIKGE